jgi:hypothetical protein
MTAGQLTAWISWNTFKLVGLPLCTILVRSRRVYSKLEGIERVEFQHEEIRARYSGRVVRGSTRQGNRGVIILPTIVCFYPNLVPVGVSASTLDVFFKSSTAQQLNSSHTHTHSASHPGCLSHTLLWT